jgi:hypothetical protein
MSRLSGGLFGGPMPSQAPAAAPAPQQGGGGGNPYAIGGNLPFQAGGNPFAGDIAGAYQSSYNSALAQNQALYGNILQGYNQTLGQQQQAQQGVSQGWQGLQSQVLGDIQGITASQSQSIRDVYAQQQGGLAQSMVNRGLGNTTVQDTMSRGLTLDEQKAQIALANQQAQLTAGYRSQLGSAGLAYQNQANMQNTGEANQALNWMNTVTAQYPNAQSYAGLQYNQGLMNALRDRAGVNAGLGLAGGGGGGGGTPFGPIAPPSAPQGANPFDYGYGGGGGGSDVYGATGPQQPNPYGTPSAYQAGSGYSPDTGAMYAGTSMDYTTDPNAYSQDPYAGYDLSGGGGGDMLA